MCVVFCHFLLLLGLLYSTMVLHVGAVLKLLDGNASLVNNAKDGVVYLFQFPRTSTTPNQAAYNLMVETWLHWKKIPFHRISNQVSLGSHSLGTAPFAYFNGIYIDGSVQIIEQVANYKIKQDEQKLMQLVLEMFNILMVDRAAGLAWMLKDEALVEIMVPPLFTNRPLTATYDNVSYSFNVDQQFWEQYFDAYNDKSKTAKFVKDFLKAKDGSDQQKVPGWEAFDGWLRNNVISVTMQTVLSEKVNGQPNKQNAGNSEAKLNEFLKLNVLKSLVKEGTSQTYANYSVDQMGQELAARWEHMGKLVQQNNGNSLLKEPQTLADAALFGILVQYFETPLNLAQFQTFSAKKGPLFEFTEKVKQSLGLDGQKWAALTKKPWQLNFDTEHIFGFDGDSPKYNGPYKVQPVDFESIEQCAEYVNSTVGIAKSCTDNNERYPRDVITCAEALMKIVNKKAQTEPQFYAKKLLLMMASYLCNGQGCEQKYLAKAKDINKKEIEKSELREMRRTVFETIIAFNDAKTGEAVRKAIEQVRAVVNKGGEAAKAAVSSPSLTNEF